MNEKKLTAETKNGQKFEFEFDKFVIGKEFGFDGWFIMVPYEEAIKAIEVPRSFKGKVISIKIVDRDQPAVDVFKKEKADEIDKKRIEKFRGSKLSLSYYYGDYYRVNSIFMVGGEGNQPDWGNMRNPFKSQLLNDWSDECLSGDKIVKSLDEYFQGLGNLESGKLDIDIPGIDVTLEEYDDLRGKGRYVSEIVMSLATMEEILISIVSPREEENKKREDMIEAENNKKIKEAIETGQDVFIRTVDGYDGDELRPGEECGWVNVDEIATPEGSIITRHNKCH